MHELWKIALPISPSEIRNAILPSEIRSAISPSEIRSAISPSEIRSAISPAVDYRREETEKSASR